MARTVATPAPEPQVLQRRLAALRRQLWLVVVLRGMGLLLAILLGSALLAGVLDWRFHLPGLVRAVILVGTLGAAIGVAYRHLFVPLSTPADDLSLALRVEERYEGLNDSLASTVQFLQEPDEADIHGSAGLRREAVRRALRRAENCDFGQVIDRRGLRLAVGAMLLCGILAGTVVFLFPTLARTALLRLASPFGGTEWPRQTQLEIDSPRERIGRNEAFEVHGRVRGVIPETAVVLFQLDGGALVEHTCDILSETDTGTFSAVLKPGQVQRKFRFQVRANDAISRWFEVAVLPPPLLVPLDGRASPQVHLQPPAYTQLRPQDLPDGSGDIDTVAGTLVKLKAAADRPLERAWIEYEPEPRWTPLAGSLGVLGAVHVGSTAALFAAGQMTFGEVPAELDPDRQTFQITFLPRVSGRYVLYFEDDAGLRNSRLFDLQVRPDPSPLVHLERPAKTRDVLDVLPTAEVPLRVVIEDPEYAIRSAWLEYSVRPVGQPPARIEQHLRMTLYDPGKGEVNGGLFTRLAATMLPREKRVEIDTRLALAKLPGVRLREGFILTLQVCADDFDDVAVDKQPGRSHEVELRIINRDVLDVILNQEQAKVQQDLLRLREQEREALKRVADTQAQLKQKGKLDGEDHARLRQAEQTQEQIRERVGQRRQDGLRRDVARILDTLQNNQLPRSAVHERMEQVRDQLDRLAREELEQIEARLSNARNQARSPEEKQNEKQRQAQMLERLAEDKEREAAQVEKLAADRPENDPLKGAAQQGAKLLRQQAMELRQAAQAVKQGRVPEPAERERHARLLERLAEEKAEAAARLDKLTDQQPESDPKHAQLEEEARRTQQQAQDLRQSAQEMRQGDRGEDEVKEQLAEARHHQEEVEKTLNDLLNRVLDPFASTSEVRGEAKTILQEQRRLLQQTEELNKQMLGDKPETLPQPQQAQLEQTKDDQRRLESRTNQLIEKMDQVRENREKKGDQETAQEMKAALEAARKGNIAGQMQQAREQIQKNQLNQAAQSQREGVKQLEELVKQLEDRREAELDRLAKKMREAQKEVEDLTREQERLQKKIKEAAAIADPRKREEELKRLAREQQQLQQKVEQLAEQLSRMRMERAGQEMARAAGQMEQAVKQLQRGQNAEEQQEDALDRLDEARRELEQARQEVDEELAREQLAKIADALKAIRDRQEERGKERAGLHKRIQQNNAWTRGSSDTLNREAEGQRQLGQDTATLAKEKLDGAPVFARVLDRAAQAMQQASQRLSEHSQALQPRRKAALLDEQAKSLQWQPEDEAAFERVAKAQQNALRRLDQLLDTLKEQSAGGMRNGGGGGQDGSGRPPGDAIPPLAQIKLLRAMQAEINQRTDEFNKQHPDLSKLTLDEQTDLQSIRREQQDVADLLEALTGPANEGDRP